MKLTGNFHRIAVRSMDMDAGELREHLAHDLHEWQVQGTKSPDWVRSFWVKIKKLARMTGMTQEEVHREIQEDAVMMGDDGGEEVGRFGAKKKKGNDNPWAICHSQLGPEKSEKFERCVMEIKKNHMK